MPYPNPRAFISSHFSVPVLLRRGDESSAPRNRFQLQTSQRCHAASCHPSIQGPQKFHMLISNPIITRQRFCHAGLQRKDRCYRSQLFAPNCKGPKITQLFAQNCKGRLGHRRGLGLFQQKPKGPHFPYTQASCMQ